MPRAAWTAVSSDLHGRAPHQVNGHVVSLHHLCAADIDLVGGKAANLGELAASGLPVPPGFVVSTLAFREVFASLGIRADAAEEIQRKIIEAEVPGPLADAILEAHARLVGDRDIVCAVRSSATAEDLAGASFAGQHGTYYYVNRERLLEMIRRCWASLWGAEAVDYRASRGIPHEAVAMAVVVQEMVRSEVSGVTFTANPLNGDRGQIVIESSWGMGAALVDGRVTPDRFVVGRDGQLREQRIAEKRYMILPRLVEGHGERLIPVPEELRRRETLRPDQIAEVAEWSLKCEKHFGAPQDVEWAITDGRFHLLQSRPITTLHAQSAREPVQGKYVLFKAIAENFTDPLTPLTADLLAPLLPPAMRLIDGRPYFNLAYVRPVIPFRLSDEELADLIYLRGAPSSLRLSLIKLPIALAMFLMNYLAFGVLFARTRGMPDDFMRGCRDFCRRVDEDPRYGPAEAFQRLWLLPSLFQPVGHHALFVNGTFFRFAPWMALLKRMLRRWLIALPPEALSLLCSGSEGVLTAEMGREIEALASVARREPAVADIVSKLSPADALARLREEPAARDFLAALERFLAVHGHRGLKEFDLRSPRWEENPALVVGMVRNYVVAKSEPAADHDSAAHARTELEMVIRRALEPLPLERLLRFRWRLIRAAAERVRYFLKLRENSRFYHIMGLGVVRKKILRLEAELLRQGKLKCREDIFFLRVGELNALQAGRLEWRDLDDRIRERRLEHLRVSKSTPPHTIGIAPSGRAAPDTTGHSLTGQCASPGRYIGIARVILDPSVDMTLQPGEILVAPYTDPAWTPLFLTAGAAVVEVGSYLSHAGTVAREYRMPCLVDVPDCTRRIQTGMRLELDADRGTVRILEQVTT
jgi:phosphohistidine swiveling domain-containing protein